MRKSRLTRHPTPEVPSVATKDQINSVRYRPLCLCVYQRCNHKSETKRLIFLNITVSGHLGRNLVEQRGIEPLTSSLRTTRSPN